jgi:hypothetical protein
MPQTDGYPFATVCGSMRNYIKMLTVAEELTRQGYLVLMPFVRIEEGNAPPYELATPVAKAALDEMHLVKIQKSEVVVVVTDSDKYYGDSTRSEIDYAKSMGIPVSFVAVSRDHRGLFILQWESA